jgi:polyisoprenoid-binding protein YceI
MSINLTWVTAYSILPFLIEAQTQVTISSHTNISTEVNGNINSVSNESTVISLNDASKEFTATVSLLPLVNNADEEDSLAEANNLLQLTFTGQFPIENFAFYSDKNNETIHAMNGMLSVNGISNPYTLTFTVRSPINADPGNNEEALSTDATFYPVKMSFIIAISPADFGLDREPAAIEKDIMVEVTGGLINKIY